MHRGAERHQQKTAQSHEQGRSRGPSLWLIGEPHREHGQHRPAQRESAQDRAGDGALLGRDERGGDQEQQRRRVRWPTSRPRSNRCVRLPVDGEAGSSEVGVWSTREVAMAIIQSMLQLSARRCCNTRCAGGGLPTSHASASRKRAPHPRRVRRVRRAVDDCWYPLELHLAGLASSNSIGNRPRGAARLGRPRRSWPKARRVTSFEAIPGAFRPIGAVA